MTILSQLASAGMATGPPLVYLDQYLAIMRKKDSTGFSMDVCGVLIVANVVRIFFWFGKRFETALLVQSILMIAFQFALLYVCLKYSKTSSLPTTVDTSGGQNKSLASTATSLLNPATPTSSAQTVRRPYNLWQWESYGTYIEFVAAVIGVNTVLYILLSSFQTYIDTIGLIALGLESTLPIPQLLSNFRRKSLSGFRTTVLAGWVFGDAFKTIYFFAQAGNSWQFKATACFQLSIDLLICVQARLYASNTSSDYTRPLRDADLGDVTDDRIEPRESIEVR